MERSGRTKEAISPSFAEPGSRLDAEGERRTDIYGMERRDDEHSMNNDGARGEETTRGSMSYDASAAAGGRNGDEVGSAGWGLGSKQQATFYLFSKQRQRLYCCPIAAITAPYGV